MYSFGNFSGSENDWFGKFQPSENAKFHKKSQLRDSKSVEMADFALLGSPKSISRKICVIEKLWNFHTVQTLLIIMLFKFNESDLCYIFCNDMLDC